MAHPLSKKQSGKKNKAENVWPVGIEEGREKIS
jgi:hypothetical protein